MDSTLHIRDAQPSDAAALAGLLGGMGWFAAYADTAPSQAEERLRGLIQSAAGGQHRMLLVAEDGAQPRLLGYCAVHWLPVAIQLGWEAYVSELFVAESARGTGAGSALLDAAVQAARERQCVRIWLINNRERPSYARGFYPRHGWTEQAEMARFVLPLAAPPQPSGDSPP